MNITEILIRSAEATPEKPFVIIDDVVLTYGAFTEKVRKLANGLKELGVQQDDKVGLLMTNSVEYMMSYFAIAAMGGCAVPFNTAFTPYEIAYQINDSDCVAIVAETALLPRVLKAQSQTPNLKHTISTERSEYANIPSLLESSAMEDVARRESSDVMHLIYTSGTTGIPKGAMITHGNINWMVATLNRFFSERTEDIYICALPLFHAYGKLQSFLSAVNIGASIVLISRFDTVAVMNAIARHRATVFFGVPTMYNMMVNSPDIGKYDLTSLRVCVSGGASMPMEILRAFEEKSGVSIAEGYGLSEVTVMTHCCPLTGVKKVGSIGHVMPGMRSKVVNEKDEDIPIGEVGELVLKGPSIMKGYYRKPEETEVAMRTGWFHTGDLVKKDEDGYYFIVDRIKDMYIRGGKNVYPREIEEVLYTYEGVREAAVIGVHDDKYGEEGLAFVVLKEGASVTAEELMAYLGDKVARFKLPKKIQFLNELPKNSIGKILKRELATNL